MVATGTPLICIRMAVGRCALASRPTAINQDIKAILLKDGVDQQFFIRLLKFRGSDLEKVSVGSTVKGITLADLRSLKLRIPNEESDQQRIAAVLDTVDAAIVKTQAVIAKLEHIRAGLLHDLLTRGLDHNGELRDPDKHPEQFKDSQLGRIPKEWRILTLRECLLDSPQNGIYKPAQQIGYGTLLIGQTSIGEDRRIDLSMTRRAEVDNAELKHFALAEENILISRVYATLAGVGQPALVPTLSEPAVYESNMMRLKVDRKQVSPRLLFELLRQYRVRARVVAAAHLSNQASINQFGLNPIPVCLPLEGEQEIIVDRVLVHEQAIKASESELRKLREFKTGLSSDLLTGRVRVPEDIRIEADHV